METDLLLAQLPDSTTYFNPFKLAAIALLFLAWVFAFQWVDRDAEFVKTRRERWNLIVLGTGIGGLAILFLPPWPGSTFFIGVGFFVLIAAGATSKGLLPPRPGTKESGPICSLKTVGVSLLPPSFSGRPGSGSQRSGLPRMTPPDSKISA